MHKEHISVIVERQSKSELCPKTLQGRALLLLKRAYGSQSSAHEVFGEGHLPLITKGRAKTELCTLALGSGGKGMWCFSQCLPQGQEDMVTVFLSCWTTLFLVLWLEKSDFSWGYFVCDSWCFSIVGLSSIQTGIYKARKTQRTHCQGVP